MSLNSIPEPVLAHLDNQTGLTAFQFQKMAPGRHFCDVVVVKASFGLNAQGIDPSPLAGQLNLSDQVRDPANAATSALKQAGDLILGKPGADIYVSGSARSAVAQTRWRVALSLGPVQAPLAHYECAVTGPRQWQHRLLKGWQLSEPQSTDSVAIEYELAWGGCKRDANKPQSAWECHAVNPSGSGFSFAGYSQSEEYTAPQWEKSSLWSSVQAKELVGLGPVARHWASRTRYAGSYDQAWQAQHKDKAQGADTDYPSDFDLRYFQCAHPSLQTAAALRGDEALRLSGLLGTGGRLLEAPVVTQLPGWSVVAHIGNGKVALPLDTVHFDLQSQQVHLVWRLTLLQALEIAQVHLELERL